MWISYAHYIHEVYIYIHNGSDSDDYRDLDLTFRTTAIVLVLLQHS